MNTATIPESETSKALRYATCQSGDYAPTLQLRIAVPEGTHMPDQQKLQQLWVAPTIGGGQLRQWREIPRVIVKRGKEHE
jgi:hypothetical protein